MIYVTHDMLVDGQSLTCQVRLYITAYTMDMKTLVLDHFSPNVFDKLQVRAKRDRCQC